MTSIDLQAVLEKIKQASQGYVFPFEAGRQPAEQQALLARGEPFNLDGVNPLVREQANEGKQCGDSYG